VLVEVLPALVILLLALIASMRLAWTAMEHNRAVAAAHWRERVLPLVWRQWASGNSEVAVARETGDGLEISFFPSLGWLPEDLSEDDPGQSLILRREPAELAGQPAWRISRRLPAAGGETRWQALLVILHTAVGEGERDP
jgi:hypothetical protein